MVRAALTLYLFHILEAACIPWLDQSCCYGCGTLSSRAREQFKQNFIIFYEYLWSGWCGHGVRWPFPSQTIVDRISPSGRFLSRSSRKTHEGRVKGHSANDVLMKAGSCGCRPFTVTHVHCFPVLTETTQVQPRGLFTERPRSWGSEAQFPRSSCSCPWKPHI